MEHDQFVPVSSPKASHSLPGASISPQPFSSSACKSPPPATRFHNHPHKPVINGINLNESPSSNFKEGRGTSIAKEKRSFSDAAFPEVPATAAGTTVLALSKEDPVFATLTATAGQDEEICEELLAIIQGGHSKCKDSGFYRRAPDVTEQMARLHIEEEPNCDHLASPVTVKSEPMIPCEGDSSPDTKKEVFQFPKVIPCTPINNPL